MARYCVACGHELRPEDRFCTRCSAPVASAEQAEVLAPLRGTNSTPITCPSCHRVVEEEGVSFCTFCGSRLDGVPVRAEVRGEERERRARRGLVQGVLCGVISLAIVALAAFVYASGGLDGALARLAPSEAGMLKAEYASVSPLEVSSGTLLVPYGKDGERLTSFEVRVKQADDPSGAAIAVDQLPSLSVSGGEGFTLEDIGSLADGTYLLCVRDSNGADFDLPPLVLGGENEETPESVEVVVPAGTLDGTSLARRGKYGAYLDVMEGLQETYGDPSLAIMKLDEDSYLAWAAGVSYAELVDFGDGTERLVVAYCTNKDLAASAVVDEKGEGASAGDYGPDTSEYRLEVYEYDAIADSAELVATFVPWEDDASQARVAYTNGPSGDLCIIGGDEASAGGIALYGMGESGSFGVVSEVEWSYGSVYFERLYQLVSESATQDGALGDADGGGTSCEETAQSAEDLITRLRTLAGDEAVSAC